ncbi:MAG: hypothetical protein AAB789_01965 [Patescibacteria group bacterium]
MASKALKNNLIGKIPNIQIKETAKRNLDFNQWVQHNGIFVKGITTAPNDQRIYTVPDGYFFYLFYLEANTIQVFGVKTEFTIGLNNDMAGSDVKPSLMVISSSGETVPVGTRVRDAITYPIPFLIKEKETIDVDVYNFVSGSTSWTVNFWGYLIPKGFLYNFE